MSKELTGECLCGNVKYTMKDEFVAFFQCHCKQCQQLSGTAFASNLFTSPDNIKWVRGEAGIISYKHPTRGFSRSFCNTCGSALPFVNKNKTSLIVPAGSLNEDPDIRPQANIFTTEKACWLDQGLQAEEFDGFPQ